MNWKVRSFASLVHDENSESLKTVHAEPDEEETEGEDGMLRPWVVTIDLHEELETSMDRWKRMVVFFQTMVSVEQPAVKLMLMWWPLPAAAKERAGQPIIDAGGIVVHKSLEMKRPIRDFIHEHLTKYAYQYGDDEGVLTQWVEATFPDVLSSIELTLQGIQISQKYPEIGFVRADVEEHMNLSGLAVVSAAQRGLQGHDVDVVVDWSSYTPQTGERPDVVHLPASKYGGAKARSKASDDSEYVPDL